MYHWLLPIFSAICGENPEHIWVPGGQPLPCCERCTGLYVAAVMAVAAQMWFQPRIGRRFLLVHALCLLQLGLFAFPWLPDWPALRSISGSLFGFGVVAFLWPAISGWCPRRQVSRFGTGGYALAFVTSLGMVPAVAEWGGRTGAFVLMCLMLAGLLTLAALAIANFARCLLIIAVMNRRVSSTRRSTAEGA